MDTPRMTHAEMRQEEGARKGYWLARLGAHLRDHHGIENLTGKKFVTCTLMAKRLYHESATPEGAAQIIADEFQAQ